MKFNYNLPRTFFPSIVSCVVIFWVFFTGCKKFVEIGPPQTQLVTASVFDNGSTATSAQTNIYTQMANYDESYNLALYSGMLADELTNYSNYVYIKDYYTNSMNASSGLVFGRWQFYYLYIYQANAIISSLQGNSNISQPIAQQLIGESKFIRAFWLFYLTNCYGDVPIVTTTDYTTNNFISRSTQTQVYQQIILDLSQSILLLNSNYIDNSDTAITTERTRPNKAAAEALLARVYLYTGKYDSAELLATEVINNNLYQLCPSLNNVFLANSTEAIWQLSIPLPTSFNTDDGQAFILSGAPSTTSSATGNCTTISPQLLNAFELGDLRRANWIDSTTNTTPAYYFPYKYKSHNTSTVTEYVMMFRLAEQYLIRSEAEAITGDSADAITDLNVIRARAGLGNYLPANQGPLLVAILHERQVELFTEWGHRWFDLIRTGAIDTVMGSSGNVYKAKGGTGSWNSDWDLYPISTAQIALDPNLTQNPGY
jgi:hypothetical protein